MVRLVRIGSRLSLLALSAALSSACGGENQKGKTGGGQMAGATMGGSAGQSLGGMGGFAGMAAGGGGISGGAGSAGMEVVPPGLEALPEPQSCLSGQSECSGFCLDATIPDGGGCHFVGSTNVTMIITLSEGMLYYRDYLGISRMDPATGAKTPLSTIQATELAVLGDAVFYSAISEAPGLHSVPLTGGAVTDLDMTVTPYFYFSASGGYLLFDDLQAGNQLRAVAEGSTTIEEFSHEIRRAYADDSDLYFSGSDGNLQRAALNDLANATNLGAVPSGVFTVLSGNLYVSTYFGIARSPLAGGSEEPLWTAGTGDYYGGMVEGPFAFPGVNRIFFIFNTEVFEHVMALDPNSGAVTRLGSFHPRCLSDLVADANYVYVADCGGIIRLAHTASF